MYGALILFDADFIHVVSITFTSVLLTELLMVALTIRTWHFVMILAELASLAIYVVGLIVFKSFFGKSSSPMAGQPFKLINGKIGYDKATFKVNKHLTLCH